MTESEETDIAEDQPEIESQQQPEAPKGAERNWDEAREVLRLQKQRIEDLESRLAQNVPSRQEEPDELDDLDPDDYLTVSKARDLARKMASKEAEKTAKAVVQRYAQEHTVREDERRMRAKHEDFDYVIGNYAIPMIKNDPALAYKIQRSKNPAEAAYKLAKISDEYEENAMPKTSPKAEKVLRNASRPTSSNAVGSLKSQVDDLSKMSPQDVWAMSQSYARKA